MSDPDYVPTMRLRFFSTPAEHFKLQQWWERTEVLHGYGHDETVTYGEWRDVPMESE